MWTHDRSAEMNANAIGVKTFEISFDDINNNIMGTSFLKKPRRIYGYKAIITSHTTAPQFREADKKCAAAAGAAARYIVHSLSHGHLAWRVCGRTQFLAQYTKWKIFFGRIPIKSWILYLYFHFVPLKDSDGLSRLYVTANVQTQFEICIYFVLHKNNDSTKAFAIFCIVFREQTWIDRFVCHLIAAESIRCAGLLERTHIVNVQQ